MGRPKGYADWEPSGEVWLVLDQVKAVLEEYKDYLPITNRQIFYRLVGAFGFEKTEKAYKRLCNYLTRARRARIIRFSAIRDDKVNSAVHVGWDSLDEFKEGIRESAEGYELDRQIGQPHHIELWCEAEGMMPQMSRVTQEFSISVYSASGFLSVTAMKDIANRVCSRDRDTVLLHVGDYDPSGESIFNTIEDDAQRFVWAHSRERNIIPVRVALTEEQVELHDLPTAPPKSSDSRSASWIGDTAQAEAMPPDILAQTVREAIEERIDQDALQEVLDREEEERGRLQEWLEELS